jgi:uncharacterized membrane protein YedE/YeeE
MNEYTLALTGGVLIGISTSLLLLFKGRVFGISGILAGILKNQSGDTLWRWMIMLGLIAGGTVVGLSNPNMVPTISEDPSRYVVAGLLVGFGTQLGGGCTSGHGVCGISRLSVRSITATITFIAAGIVAVGIFGG